MASQNGGSAQGETGFNKGRPLPQNSTSRSLKCGKDNDTKNDETQLSDFRRRFVVVLCSSSIYFEGINLSLSGPFFPEEADKKGLCKSDIGWVTGSFDFASLAFSFLIASVISPQNIKLFYCSGMIWCAISVAAFGCLVQTNNITVFFWLCIFARSVNGVGASMLQNTALPIAVRMYPEKSGLITAIIQTSLGLGVLTGTPMGSLLLPIGGYELPFVVTGVAQAIAFSLALFVIPSTFSDSGKVKIKHSDFIKFVCNPKIFNILIPATVLFSISGFRDSAFALYMKQTLGMSQSDVGYAFIPTSVAYFVAAPTYGLLVELGYGAAVAVTAHATGPFILFLFYLPDLVTSLETTVWALLNLFLDGLIIASVFNPHFLITEKLAVQLGYTNVQTIKTLAASCYNLISASSRAFGAFIIGGYMNEYLGFYHTCFWFAVALLFTGTWYISSLYRYGLIKKLFYESSYTVMDECVSPIMSLDNGHTHRSRTISQIRSRSASKSIQSFLIQSVVRPAESTGVLI